MSQVRARVPLDVLGGGADLAVRAPNLPRTAEPLHAQDRLVRDAVRAEIFEHPEERLQDYHVLDDLLLADRVKRLDDVVVLEKEQRLTHAVPATPRPQPCEAHAR